MCATLHQVNLFGEGQADKNWSKSYASREGAAYFLKISVRNGATEATRALEIWDVFCKILGQFGG